MIKQERIKKPINREEKAKKSQKKCHNKRCHRKACFFSNDNGRLILLCKKCHDRLT